MLDTLASGPAALLGLLLGSQSVASHTITSALEFSFSFLLASFLLLAFAGFRSSNNGKKRDQIFPKRITPALFIRSVLLCASTTCWAHAASHISSNQLVFVEMSMLALLFPGLPQEMKQALSVALAVLIVFLLLNGMGFAVLCFAAVFIRDFFNLFKDSQVLLVGSLVSLGCWLMVHMIGTSDHHATYRQQPQNDRVRILACVVLFVLTSKRVDMSRFGLGVTLGYACLLQACLYFSSSALLLIGMTLIYGVALRFVHKQDTATLLPTTTRRNNKTAPTTFSVLAVWRDLSKDSKHIAMFLSLTLSFMFVELVMGLYTNSLGLISDAGHMFFDSAALLIGLVASVLATKRRPDAYYTFGYDRLQLIAGFVNAIFLAFVSVFVLSESLERFTAPPEIKTEGLLLTSVLGLVINGIGLVFFHDHSGHSHDGDGEGCSHGHSHANENMHGVFLHVLADALGSVGVIISSLLVQYKQWYIADPICSFFVSMLIFASVIPLLKSTTNSLMLRTPQELEVKFNSLLERLKRKPGVLRISSAHLWRYSPKVLVCTVSFVVAAAARDKDDDEVYAWLVNALKQEIGATDVTVQVCTDSLQQQEL